MGGMMANVEFHAVVDFDEGRQIGVSGRVGERVRACRVKVTTTREEAIAYAKARVQAFFDGKFPHEEQ